MMPNKLKGLVSKKKIRFQKDGFDLDLTYITNRVIAMGYPAQNWEGIYRNHIDDVVSFFKRRHGKHYQIYNLCNERHIDEQKFEPNAINHSYPFDDHNPPRFTQMLKCCEEIKSYLDSDDQNIVAVQCKAGKGRTGVIVCSYLLLDKLNKNATEALQFYGRARTTNGKGVTIPSQIRYIYYYDHLLRNNLSYTDTTLKFDHLVLEELPNMAGNGYEIQVIVYDYDKEDKLRECHTSQFYEVKKDSQRSLKLCPDEDWMLLGDLKFQIVLKSKFGKRMNLCHCWLNTFFVVHKPAVMFLDDKINSNKLDVHFSGTRKTVRNASDPSDRIKPNSVGSHVDGLTSSIVEKVYKFTLQKSEIDKANKDISSKIFPPNFALSFFFEDPSSSFQPNLPKNNSGTETPPEVTSSNKPLQVHLSATKLSIDNRSGSHRGRNPAAMFPEDQSDFGDDHSESSESSTNNAPSDLDDNS